MLGPAGPVANGSSLWDAQGSVWDVLLRILAVLSLLILLSVLARRWSGVITNRGGPAGAMQVLASLALGPQKALYLIRVGRRAIVVGVTGRSIQLLLELDPEDCEELGIQHAHRQDQGDRFARLLQRFGQQPGIGAEPRGRQEAKSPEGEGRH